MENGAEYQLLNGQGLCEKYLWAILVDLILL
jgi:hypothetical protein